MSEISSGLVAVAWIAPDEDRFRVRICEDRPTDAPLWSPMCWVSDAEAIIAQKDAEILEQCRINGMGAEREVALLGKMERQAERIKELEASPISEEVIDILRSQIAKQSAALKLASLALSEGVEYVEEPPEKNCTCHLSPPCNDCVDHSAVREFFIDARKALAAIDALGDME